MDPFLERGKSNAEPLSENHFGQAPKLAEDNITTNNIIVIPLIILLITIAIETIIIIIIVIVAIRTKLLTATSSEHVEFAAWLRICTELPGISVALYKLLWKDPIGIQQTAPSKRV